MSCCENDANVQHSPQAYPGMAKGLCYVWMAGLLGVYALIVVLQADCGLYSAWDWSGHLAKTQFVQETATVASWFPAWHGGFPTFELYPPAYYVCSAVFCAVFEPLLGRDLAFTLFNVLPLVLFPLGIYFMLISMQAPRPVARNAAFLAPLVCCSSGGPFFQSVFTVGLLPHSMGFVIYLFAIGCVARTVADGRTSNVLGASFLLGLTVLTHTFSGLFALLTTPLYYLCAYTAHPSVPLRLKLLRLLVILALALGLSAVWWIPALSALSRMGSIAPWTVSTSLLGLSALFGQAFANPVLRVLSGVGVGFLVLSAYRKRLPAFVFVLSSCVLTWFLASPLSGHVVPMEVLVRQSARFAGFCTILCCTAGGLMFSILQDVMYRWGLRRALLAMAAVLLPLYLYLVYGNATVGNVLVDALDIRRVQEAFSQLRMRTQPYERVLTESGPRNIRGLSPNILTHIGAMELDWIDFNGGFQEAVSRPPLTSTPGAKGKLIERARDVGIRHMICWRDSPLWGSVDHFLSGKGARMDLVWSNELFAVFEISHDSTLIPSIVETGPRKLVFAFSNDVGDAWYSFGISYHPNLQVCVGQTVCPTRPDGDHILWARLPPQSGKVVQVELRTGCWDFAGAACSGVALVAAFVVAVGSFLASRARGQKS